jgi:hypothetical protein
VNRSEFQTLADVRIREAKVLLDAGMWDGAYYLAGYAVECALKACIAKLTKAETFPPKVEEVRNFYTHDLNTLVKAAGLSTARDTEAKTKPQFGKFWTVVLKWNEQARYERKSQADADALHKAINDPTDGVLQWVRRHW